MRLTEDERTNYSRFRDVADLRVQFLCEYRFYLQEKLGQTKTEASITGSRLHDLASIERDASSEQNRLLPLLIFIAALILGYMWIFG